VPTLNFFRNF